ncbi:MAG: FecR domain-containing protein [Pseudomonadota bacterium]
MALQGTNYPYEIRLQAMEWRVRGEAGEVDLDDDREFQAWLAADVRHEQAFDRATTAWSAYGALDREKLGYASPTPEPTAWLGGVIAHVRALSQGHAYRIGGVAAAFLVVALVGFLAANSAFWRTTPPTMTAYASEVGAFKTVTLEDGSTIILGPATKLEVAFSAARRDIDLVQGAAVFDVTSDPRRPFVVNAEAFSARALGTVFDVRNNGGMVRLSVLEGAVAASYPRLVKGEASGIASRREVKAGEGLSADAAGGLSATRSFKPERFASWRENRLRYLGASLQELIADANRYSDRPIVINDEVGDLSDLKVTFAFDGENIEGMLDALPSLFPVAVDDADPAQILIRAGDSD